MLEQGIYLDNAAATRLDERVLEAMNPYFFEVYSIATSEFGYSLGIEAKEALEEARIKIAEHLGAMEREIVFTSGSTESSNLALKGVVKAADKVEIKHIIISGIEDFPVLQSAKELERNGVEVTYLPVDEFGLVDPQDVRGAITERTVLVSIQQANQEIGTLQPVQEIGEICRDKGVLFHMDATHSFARVPIDVRELAVDLISISAHTIHGPKGVGALYVRKGTKIRKLQDGGFQEFNLRAGYENIPGAVGFAKAIELVDEAETGRLTQIRDRLIDRIMAEVPDVTLNGHRTQRLSTNANISFHYIEGESITLHLDMYGISVSTGSACFSRSLEASHVITGIGGGHERAHGSIRMTLGRYNTIEDVDVFVERIKVIAAKLREISPLG
jgi:cysteine desulfurase